MTHLVDLQFQGASGVIACYVLESSEGPILVDPGPSSTLGTLRAGLQGLGSSLSEVRHVLLTHVHLDHAGSAGSIARESGATVYVHSRGAPHLVRPERLLASATQIYGEHMDQLWGSMPAVPEGQLVTLEGGEVLSLGGVTLEALYTPGHAVHHVAWRSGDELFCGDVAGVRLAEAQTPRAPTPPPDINLEVWRESVARLQALDARVVHLTHFGSYSDVRAHWQRLLVNMERDAEVVREGLSDGQDLESLTHDFVIRLEAELNSEGADLVERMRFACPAWMSVQGLTRYWRKRELRSAEVP